MSRVVLLALSLITSVGASPAESPPAPDLERAEGFYVICGACHGARGQGEQNLNAPALAGQDGEYLLRQLTLFASGLRGAEGDPRGRQMQVILDEIASEEDWRSIVAYIQSFPPAIPSPSLNGNIERGAILYETCAACHGEDGAGRSEFQAPNLTVLQDSYIVEQLRKFRLGLRGGNPKDLLGAQMKGAVGVLETDQDLMDVATYIASCAANEIETDPR